MEVLYDNLVKNPEIVFTIEFAHTDLNFENIVLIFVYQLHTELVTPLDNPYVEFEGSYSLLYVT